MGDENNRAEFVGTIGECIRESYQIRGEKFARIVLHVQRASGTIDKIPMSVNEKVMKKCPVHEGAKVSVKGRVQSNREWDEERMTYHVKLYVQVKEMRGVPNTEPDKNEVFLSGSICGNPILRKTPRAKTITEFSILCAVKERKTHRIWCIAWGNTAHFLSQKNNGDQIALQGRFQSRDYIKRLDNGKEELRVTYEISVMELVE